MLKLHHAPGTRAGRIAWLLEALKLPGELKRTEFHPQALKSDEHRARHPLGHAPVLEAGGVTLNASGAIVESRIARHSECLLHGAPPGLQARRDDPPARRCEAPGGPVCVRPGHQVLTRLNAACLTV